MTCRLYNAALFAFLAACHEEPVDLFANDPITEVEIAPIQLVPPSDPIPQPVPETDCAALLEAPATAMVGKRTVRRNGRFAAGSLMGDTFVPMLYFHRLGQAYDCAADMQIAEWSKDHWEMH